MSKLKKSIFTGAATALITPFKNGKIDYERLKQLIDQQIDGGIDALVIAGTTGEAATLDHEEHCELLRASVEYTASMSPSSAVAITSSPLPSFFIAW